MHPLNLPSFEYQLREGTRGGAMIFDPLRKKFVKLIPEEWVRQHILNYLTVYLSFPPSLIGVEVLLQYNQLNKRSDIVAFGKQGEPLLVVECKAPTVALTEKVFYQIAMYNRTLSAKYLVVSNGVDHIVCQMNSDKSDWNFLPEIPNFNQICP